MKMKKCLLIVCLIFSLIETFNSVVIASEWKEISNDNIQKLKLKVYLNTKSYKCDDNYIFYIIRYKGKNVGDYINTICSNYNDYSSAIIETKEFNKNYKPEYPNISDISDNFMKLDESSILSSIVPIVCRDIRFLQASAAKKEEIKNNKTKIKNSKKEKTYKTKVYRENIFVKFFKGVGKIFEFILILPFAVLFALLGS